MRNRTRAPQAMQASASPHGAEIDADHAVLGRVDDGEQLPLENDEFPATHVAEEDRVLQPRAVPFHRGAGATEPAELGDVVRDEITPASHEFTG